MGRVGPRMQSKSCVSTSVGKAEKEAGACEWRASHTAITLSLPHTQDLLTINAAELSRYG